MDSENCGAAAFITANEVDALPSASITVLAKLRGWRDANASPVPIQEYNKKQFLVHKLTKEKFNNPIILISL
jgi:hypothetical protein